MIILLKESFNEREFQCGLSTNSANQGERTRWVGGIGGHPLRKFLENV